jgi:hypothetical protein
MELIGFLKEFRIRLNFVEIFGQEINLFLNLKQEHLEILYQEIKMN